MLVKLVLAVLVISGILWLVARIWNPTTPPTWYRRPTLLSWARRIFLGTLALIAVVLIAGFVVGAGVIGWVEQQLAAAQQPAAPAETVAEGPCPSTAPKATDPSGRAVPYAINDVDESGKWQCSPAGWVAYVAPAPAPTAVVPVDPANPPQDPAAPAGNSGEAYTASNGTVVVGDNLCTVEFTLSVDNHPTEWLNQRPGILYLYQSGIGNQVEFTLTVNQGCSVAIDGDWINVDGVDYGVQNDPSDVIVFFDQPGVYTVKAASFGMAVGVYGEGEDRAGNVLADRRAATHDNRPEWWIPASGDPIQINAR